MFCYKKFRNFNEHCKGKPCIVFTWKGSEPNLGSVLLNSHIGKFTFLKSHKILKMWFRYFLTSGIIRHFLHTRLKTAGFMDAELKTWNVSEFGTLKLLGKSLSKFDKCQSTRVQNRNYIEYYTEIEPVETKSKFICFGTFIFYVLQIRYNLEISSLFTQT